MELGLQLKHLQPGSVCPPKLTAIGSYCSHGKKQVFGDTSRSFPVPSNGPQSWEWNLLVPDSGAKCQQ